MSSASAGALPTALEPHPPLSWRRPILTTLACNNRCVFCSLGELTRDGVPREVEAIIADLDAAGDAEAITFVGGEPTTHPALADLVAAAKARGIPSIGVQTNGRRLAYPGYARRLLEAGLDVAEVSLHGAQATTHDFHVRVPGAFRQTARGVRNLVALRRPVGLGVVLTRSSFREVAGLRALCERLGATALHLAPARSVGAAREGFARIVPRLSLLGEVLRDAFGSGSGTGSTVAVSGVVPCLAPQRLVLPAAADRDAVFPPGCAGCAARAVCPGLEPDYARVYGCREVEGRALASPPLLAEPKAAALFTGLGFSSRDVLPRVPPGARSTT